MIIQGTTLRNTGFVVDVQSIVSGALVNLDTASGVVGSTWTNTGTLGSALNYTLFNNPTTATVNGTTVLQFAGGGSQAPGAMTNQYAFNGTGITALASSSQAFTIEIWCKPSLANDSGCLIKEWAQSSGGAPSTGWEDSWISFAGGYIQVGCWTNTMTYSTAGAYTANNWYHICMTYNGSNQIKTYVNGNLAQTLSAVRVAQGTYAMFTIAACERFNYQGTTNYFTGQVGPFRVYNKQLSAAEAVQNFNAVRFRYGV